MTGILPCFDGEGAHRQDWRYARTGGAAWVFDGLFDFSGVKPGEYNLVANAPGIGLGILNGVTIVSNTNYTILLSEIFKGDVLPGARAKLNLNSFYLFARKHVFSYHFLVI